MSIETAAQTLGTEIKAEIVKIEGELSPTVERVEVAAKAIGSTAIAYIEVNGGKSVYAIAMSLLTGMAAGTPWATVGATLVAQAETAGITIAKGAESVILAQAQADLVAAGAIVAPTTGAVVAATITSAS